MTNEMKSRIMKRAHEHARSYTGISYREALSRGLKSAWSLYKANGTVGLASDYEGQKATTATITNSESRKAEVVVAGWFLNKNYNSNERIAITTARYAVIEKETAKALLVRFETEYGNIKGWFPKSVCTIAA